MIRIKKIMVPVDFSEPSKKAVNYGLSLALEFEARLILAHIVAYDSLANLTAKTRLLELIPADYRERIDFELIVKSGDVRQELLGIVEDREIDLVVMGSRGRSYFERMLLGSVTERLLRKLHVPILTVSHLDPEREMGRDHAARSGECASANTQERHSDDQHREPSELRRQSRLLRLFARPL